MRRCIVCGSSTALDSHHVHPLEYGGLPDGEQVLLCPTHHRNIHRYAALVYQGKKPPDNLIPPGIAHSLAQYIVLFRRMFDDNGELAENARNIIQIKCTPEELAIAHDLKRRLGFRSLERMIKVLIAEKYMKG